MGRNRVAFIGDSRLDDNITKYPYHFDEVDFSFIESRHPNSLENIIRAQEHFSAFLLDTYNSATVRGGNNTSNIVHGSEGYPIEVRSLDIPTGMPPIEFEYTQRGELPIASLILIGRNDWAGGNIELTDFYIQNIKDILEESTKRGIVPMIISSPVIEFRKYAEEDRSHIELINFQLDYEYLVIKLAQENNIPILNLWNSMSKVDRYYGLGDRSGHYSAIPQSQELTSDLFSSGIIDESGRNREFNFQILRMLSLIEQSVKHQ